MKRYKAIVEGVEKFFNVTPDRYDAFIAKYPDAVLVEEPETEEDSKADTEILSTVGNPGFQKDTAESADVVSEDVAQENTDLLSDGGSSGSQAEDDYVKELLKSPFNTKTKPEDFAVVEDYVTHEQQVKDIADNVRSESLEAINSALPNLKRTDYGSFDYSDVDIKEASIQATRNFIKNDDFINNELTPQIKEKLKPLTDNKIEEVRAKYKFDNPENVTEENIAKAEAELNAWYSEQFNNEMSADPAFKKRIEAFDINKDVILGEDVKRFRSVNNDGNTVSILGFDTGIDAQRATDKAALWMLDLSKTNITGSSMAKIALELFNVGRQIETSMSKAGTVGKLQMDMEKQNSFKRNQELAEKNNWTEDTEGHWIVPDEDDNNSASTYKFMPKYVRDLGYADQDRTTYKTGANFVEGTWGEYQKTVAEVTQKDIQQFGKRISELSEEELKESLVETKSWDRIKDGEGGISDLLAVGLAQGSQVALAATPLGFLSSASQIGGDIYYTKIEEEAKRRNNIENAEDLTPEMYAEVAADTEFTDKAINVAMSGGALAGALDKFGAGKTMKLFNNVSAKAILRGGAKDYFKRVANFGVENTKAGFIEAGTETLQEVVQAFASGTEVTPEQLFDAGGQAFISNLVFGGGGKAIQTTAKELQASYSILSGKFNKNSSEAFFNQQLSDIDLAIKKSKDKFEIEDLQEKRKIIEDYRNANVHIPKGVNAKNRQKLVDNIVRISNIKETIKQGGDILGPELAKELAPELETLNASNSAILNTPGALDKVKKIARQFDNVNVSELSNDEAVKVMSEVKNKIVESTGYGFIYTDDAGVSQIVINKDVALEDGVVNTGAHEFLHYALKEMFKTADTAVSMKALSSSIDNILKNRNIEGNTRRYEQRLENYRSAFEKGEITEATFFEEKLVVLSEAMLDGEFDIKRNSKLIGAIKDFARRLLSTLGVKAKFNTDQDVINFIKDYNRSIGKGKFTKGQKKTLRDGAKGKLITKSKSKKKTESVKESMSPKMRRLLDRKEATEDNSYLDPEERDNKLQGINQQINELKDAEAAQNKSISSKAKPSGPMTLEEADAAYEDALDAWEDAPDNDALLEEVEKALKEVETAKNRFDAGEEVTPEVAPEDKPTEKKVIEKKERSKKKYSLTDDAKAKIEPLLEEAQSMNKELSAKEKETDAAKIAKIEAKPESEMTRTEKAIAIKNIKDNPTRTTKPAKLQRIETEILDRLEKPIGKAVTFFTKLLYDKIPKEAAAVIGGRDAYKSAAQARITSMVINEFKKTTINRKGEETINDVEDLIFNRGGLRLLTLATDLGVASASEGISQQFDNVSNNIGTEDTMFDEGGLQMSVEGKFKISSLLASGARYKQAMDAAVEFWETNRGNSPVESFSKLPGFTAEVLAEMFDIPVGIFDKRISRSPNLNKETYKKAMDAITKPYAVFKLTKEGITIEERTEIDTAEAFTKEMQSKGFEVERVADQNMLQTLFKFLPQLSAEDYKYLIDGGKGRSKGKSTGVPNNVVKLAFDKIQRNTTGVGNKSGNLRRLTYKEVLNGIGGFVDTDGKAKMKMGITGRSPEGQTFIGVMRTLNRMVSNELSRSAAVGLDPMTIKDIAAGKNVLMESKRIDLSSVKGLTVEVSFEFSKWYASQNDPSSAKQLQELSKIAGRILGDQGRKLFNAELAYNFDKLGSDASLESIRNSIGTAWGKVYKWLYRDQGFQKAVGNLNENSNKEDVRRFLQAFSRAWRNDSYQKVSTNEQMVEMLESQGVDFEGLGFELEKRGNKGYVYEVIDGKRDFVNNPTTILEIKNNAFDRIQAYGLDSINEVQKLQKVVLDIIDTSLTVDDAIAAIEAMSIGQMATLRRISYLRNVYKSDGPSVLEHVISLAIIKETLKEYARGNVENIQEFLDGLYLDVIPKEIDDLLAKVGTEARYTPKIKALLKKYKLKSFDVVGERNSLKESKRAKNVRLATDLAMTRKSDAKRKGISVLDFDDTLARTASQVLYTLPNGKKGKLTAEQFAKDGDRMTKEGVEWDFSEFSKVVDGKKGPLFEKTKRLVAKFGNENVFVLTARPANSKFAIHEFLSGLGLDIPLQNITGLADSNPQAKGDWITGKAAEGYNDFFFADDHIKNVMAVGQAINDAGVKGKTILADPSVKYSLKIKRNYVNQVTKGRPDLNEDQIAEQMDFVMSHVEGMVEEGAFPPNKLAKYKKLGLHFLAKSPLILPEDGYKINEAIQIAEQKNIDPFKYNNPNDLMDKFAGTVKAKRVDPDNVKEFSNKKVLPKGVTVYDVSNNREGQEAVRKVLDADVNPKANPWCAFARTRITVREQDEYLRTRQPENVDSAFVSYEFTYQDTGEVETDYYPMSSINNKINLSRDEMMELAEGGFGPGFINAIPVDQQGMQKNDDAWEEVHQDNGRMGRIKYKEYYLLTDREQTQQEFLDSGGLKYPPAPETNKLVKDESYMDYDMFEHYGTGRPGRTVTEDVDGETKVVKKEDATPGGWKIAFVNGKLKSVKNLGGKEQKWWDLRDVATDDLKISKDGPGERTVMNIETGKTKKIPADPSLKWSMRRDKKLNKAIDDVVNLDRNSDRKTKGKNSQSKYIKDLLDVFDMDGEGQTLLDKATRMLDLQWNDLYSEVTGLEPDTTFNEVEAQKLGDEVSKGLRSRAKAIVRGYLVESGADDFLGLLYRTLPKGKSGEAMMRLYEDNLLKPFAIASREIEKARIKMAKRYRDIKTNNGISDKVLNGKVTLKTKSGKDITYTSEDAVRVYMWRKQGIEVPGLSEQNELDLAEHVKQSDELYRFTLNLMAKTLPEEFADPSKNWVTGSLKTDYLEGINKAKRKEALRFWSKGIETIFSEENINKLRAQHGTKYVAALQNSIERMKTGRNAVQSLDSDTQIMLQFIAGAVGNIMFLNTRSAGLQLLSATNFMAAGDNTWGESLKTIFTQMPTLAKDYKMLMNTDFLLDRRNALKMDVNDSDIARIAEGKGLQGKLARFLQWGYVFTQAADSRAIALGGAVYYRNAYDKLIKQGVDPKTAKEQALLETTEHAQSSQQSSRADKISKQQASTGGRLMLAFANTPMQYNRLVQKSYLDLVNGRGNKGKNLYNIAYYGLAQNLLFTVAQGAMLTAVYGTLFGDDEEEDKLDYNQKVGIANGVLSSWLRGMGIWGNALNALKQTFMNVHAETKKKRPEYDVAAIKGLTSIIPAVGSKFSKIYTTTRAIDYNKDFLFDVNEGNVFKNYAKMPGVIILGQAAAFINIPLDRAQRKLANLMDAVNYAQSDLTRAGGLLFGHSLWSLQSDEEKEADYQEQRQRRKGIKKANKIKEEKSKLTPEELRFSDLKDLKKQQQVDSLTKYGLTKKQIRNLKYEKDRVEAIIKLQNQKRKNSLK